MPALLKNMQQNMRQLANIKAMVVDDDVLIHEFVALGLDILGITNVLKAASGEEALAYLDNPINQIDVIFCDLNMPKMDGLELLRHFASKGFNGAIVLMSGEDARILKSATSLAEAHNLTVLGYLEKPLKLETFKEILSTLKNKVTIKNNLIEKNVSEADIRNAIKYDQFSLVYQPKVDLLTRQVVGVESLARWLHPKKGYISPIMFINAAEEYGMINQLTDVLFIKALNEAGNWTREGLDLSLSVNLSVDSLDRLELPEYLVSCAAKAGLDVSTIMIEITESRLMRDVATSLEILSRLCLKGLSLSIDDFGTGYSTMETLRLVPFAELKIDRSFVTGASHDESKRAILESSIELAKKLDIKTVAEGIETDVDWQLVKSLGCDQAQGYFIAKPMGTEKLPDWLDDWNSRKDGR
ncbi:MAG: EAL domain-containing response regulator [Thioalkalispiraceae bacterium]|jgi:EAL domain-containing protein (putative c-di-GMP-specific phosphodiesterase class I)/FixJ family two-component response regulator